MRKKMYMDVSEFARAIDMLGVYPENFNENDVEKLAHIKLVSPRLRLLYPKNIARRIYFEGRNSEEKPVGAVEPDGNSWELACELYNNIDRYKNYIVYGSMLDPLARKDGRYKEFLSVATNLPYESRRSYGIDVSSNLFSGVRDHSHVKYYYSSWQILLAAEVEQSGMNCMLNWHDDAVSTEMMKEAFEDGKLPKVPMSRTIRFAHQLKEFKKFEGVFDAITAFAERSEIEFFLIHKNKSGRFLQSDEETQQLDISNKEIAFSCASCFSINEDCLIELIRYLFERWLHWDRRKRESVCEIYKSYLSESFKFSMLFLNESFNELKAKVESNQEHRISIVDQVWPDWEGDSRKKFIRTISVSLKGFVNADSNVLDQFVNFISSSGLESFFWQLEIFEDHALRGNSFRTSGMHASIQGMALVVEHIVRSLTSSIPGTVIRSRDDLLDHFKALFAKNSLISALLKDNGITGPARERLESLEDWNKMREHLKTLRSKGGEDSMVADLVAARYVRGAVHYKFPGAGHFELEELFVTLMRAAFFCFDAKRQLIIKANQ